MKSALKKISYAMKAVKRVYNAVSRKMGMLPSPLVFVAFFYLEEFMNNTKRLVICALMLALCLVLPFFTGQIPEIGNMLLPMHLPVLLAGFVVGGPSAMMVGAVAPLLRSVIWVMPPMFPKAIGMAFELATYGLVTGVVYKRTKKDTRGVFVALITAMIAGRIVWGVVSFVLYGIMGNVLTIQIFMAEAFLNAIPGIAVQLVLIPVLVSALKKTNVMK